MNREKAYRQSILDALAGMQVDYGEGLVDVPVFDNKLEDTSNIYVLIEAQTAQNDSNFVQPVWRCMLEISIYHVQQNSATADVVDAVSEEIENRLSNKPWQGLIISPAEWTITNTVLASVNSFKYASYADSAGTVVQKILQFNSQLIKQ